ncbi:hypothetical protein FEM48_Zijuj04G0125700 [Ziziphus jujuba var. spinosa]|uniref:Aminotransferase class I/classII large domain-containing protein n=1 Tax=Ziziphus jujuba var. spinosa TaxID=714518 RepID=A0A978VJX1_ZIZJJ|nr:hypothetical protein FEM48_Zijuj04G0125700 [Ziziphus jujuba var. spinosa]
MLHSETFLSSNHKALFFPTASIAYAHSHISTDLPFSANVSDPTSVHLIPSSLIDSSSKRTHHHNCYAIAEYLSQDLPYQLSPDDVYRTAGCTQAIEAVVSALARPGANILLPKPGYPQYVARAAFDYLQVRHFDPEGDWEVDLSSGEALADDNTAAIVIINPSNPCGYVFKVPAFEEVVGSNPFVPMEQFASILSVLTLGSSSERWIVPGWRLGWIVTNDPNGILKKLGEKWKFKGNKELNAASISVAGVVELLFQNINANDHRPTIVLGGGDPSRFPSYRTTSSVVDSVRSFSFNSYPPTVGLLPARSAIAKHLSQDLPYQVSPDDVYITAGCTQAIEIVISALARPGANILLPRPGYPQYEARAAFDRLEVRHLALIPERGWEVDLDSVEALADDNTAAIVIISPSNPCGNVFKYQHFKKVYVLGHLVIGSNPFVPMGEFASIVPVLTLGSISKRWIVPGWRLGWIVTNDPNEIFKKTGIVESIKNYLDISTDPATVIQGAVPQILEKTNKDFFSNTIVMMRQTADMLYDRVKEIPCLTCPQKPEGAMSVLIKLNLSLLENIVSDMDFCLKLAKEESLIILPEKMLSFLYTEPVLMIVGVVVGLKNWLRVSFAVELPNLEDGLERLKAFCQRHANKQ